MSTSPWADTSAALFARHGTPAQLAEALQASRRDTLSLWDAYVRALPDLRVPEHPTLNPPVWELGHIGWFQTRWLERHALWRQGTQADPTQPLRPARPTQADELFDSSQVPHSSRWGLPLPSVEELRGELAQGLDTTLAMLAEAESCRAQDKTLYFFRLCLLHEDMHHEAGLYMARALGVPVHDPRCQPRLLPAPPSPLAVPAGLWHSTSPDAPGFAFDNELGTHAVEVPAFEIDAQPVRWAEFLPFVGSGGYADPRWWTPEGWRWLQTDAGCWRALAVAGAAQAEPPDPGDDDGVLPRYLRQRRGRWECWRGGRWGPLDLAEAASHLSAHEAQAWCAWAGCRLPTEFEWEQALAAHPAAFRWGDVWEWTASLHQPFPGFTPHPYRDYAAPWFDGRPVLKGASHLTQPRMRHPRYRNFFTADRNDLAAGFRTCPR
jgi:gamma-glutamyl hercynylcysteine S-oxide synthase